MSWTYAGPDIDAKDRVRFLIRDTDETAPLISDEEILWALQDTGNHYSAAALCARFLASEAQAGAGGQVTVGDMSEPVGGLTGTEWLRLAEDLERRAVMAKGAIPYLGGSSITGKNTARNDPDRTPPRSYYGEFTRRRPLSAVTWWQEHRS